MATEDASTGRQKTHRSPNYPAYDLAEAIEKARIIYDEEKRSATTPDVIAHHLGYSATNGPGGRALSGLRQYGLLEDAGGKTRLSEGAFHILHQPEGSRERSAALRAAALAPPLYKSLLDEYPDGIPSDATLKSTLLRRNFNPAVLGQVIADFRKTLAVAGLVEGSYTDSSKRDESMGGNRQETLEEEVRQVQPPLGAALGAAAARTLNAGGKVYRLAFAGDGSAELRISGQYEAADLEDLETFLEVTLRGLKRSKPSE